MTTLFTYNDGSLLSPVSARFLITIPVWEANRVLDTDHVRTLEAAIERPEHVQGPFTVIKYKNEETNTEEWRIIDGQHRQEVLRRYFERYPNANQFPVLCRLYNTTDHAGAVKIFQAINMAKPMIYRGSPEERLNDIIQELKAFFVTGPKNSPLIRTGCNRPFLSEVYLVDAVKRHRLHERSGITPKIVCDHAEAMNVSWSLTREACGVKITDYIWARAQEYGFYLGLDPKCGWLAGL